MRGEFLGRPVAAFCKHAATTYRPVLGQVRARPLAEISKFAAGRRGPSPGGWARARDTRRGAIQVDAPGRMHCEGEAGSGDRSEPGNGAPTGRTRVGMKAPYRYGHDGCVRKRTVDGGAAYVSASRAQSCRPGGSVGHKAVRPDKLGCAKARDVGTPPAGAEDPARERMLKASQHFGPGSFP